MRSSSAATAACTRRALSAGLQAQAREGYDAENSGDTLAGVRTLLTTLVRYEPWRVELRLDDREAYRGPAGQLFLANLALFGFGFHVNPGADPADGLIEAIVLKAPDRRSAALMLARAYRGRHLDHPGADVERAGAPCWPPRCRWLATASRSARAKPRWSWSAAACASPHRRGYERRAHWTRWRPAPGASSARGLRSRALGVGLARGITTTYLPVLLDARREAPALIGLVMLVNPLAGFAAPLAVGLWSDRRSGKAPRVPFVLGGGLLAAGGLVAVALGTQSSYLVLALAGLATYAGLSGALTAQRAAIAPRFDDEARPAVTSSQELQRSAGSLVGVVGGGLLVATYPRALFVAAAVLVVALVQPTVGVLRQRVADHRTDGDKGDGQRARPRDLLAVVKRPGAREVVAAQTLWVLAYVAPPTFFVLYAERVLALEPPSSSFLLGGVGLAAGEGMLAGGRLPARFVQPALMLGTGLLAAAPFTDVTAVLGPFVVAAFGFGLVNALGFAYFTRFVEEGASGRFSGVYFAVRAAAAAVALPLAGLTIELTGSYRGLLLQGAVAFLAVVPLMRAARHEPESA